MCGEGVTRGRLGAGVKAYFGTPTLGDACWHLYYEMRTKIQRYFVHIFVDGQEGSTSTWHDERCR